MALFEWDCKARSHMERLTYFVHNEHICAQTFYAPLLKHFLQALLGSSRINPGHQHAMGPVLPGRSVLGEDDPLVWRKLCWSMAVPQLGLSSIDRC